MHQENKIWLFKKLGNVIEEEKIKELKDFWQALKKRMKEISECSWESMEILMKDGERDLELKSNQLQLSLQFKILKAKKSIS